jgi:hypothetical protein
MSADPHKQQIPPLRYAPVGMTNYVNHFTSGLSQLNRYYLKPSFCHFSNAITQLSVRMFVLPALI